MQVSNTSVNSNLGFKSVYPVYHWCKMNGKYRPVSDRKSVENCQRVLSGMLNRGDWVDLEKCGKSFLIQTVQYISHFDKDYKNCRFTRSYYYNHGGYQHDSAGNVKGFEPCAYLLTGVDAADFEETYGKPIGKTKNLEYLSQKEIYTAVMRAKMAYITKGLKYVKDKAKKFVDKESKTPLELHTICTQNPVDKKWRMIKMEFFKTGDKENPLVRNDII